MKKAAGLGCLGGAVRLTEGGAVAFTPPRIEPNS